MIQPSKYQLVVGLEIHGQINSSHKLFSRAGNKNDSTSGANTTVTHLEFGMPGILPIVNKEPILKAVIAGLALNGKINSPSFFDRKHYFYADLPTGYQITQFFLPIIQNAYLEIKAGGNKKIQIKQMHIEADAGKNIHTEQYSLLDYNRVSVGLIETVTEPQMHSAEEAAEFAEEFHRIFDYIGVCDGDMEKGNFRMDVNISVKDLENNTQSNRCEVKNLNSFNNMKKAIAYEYKRHIKSLENGTIIPLSTRFFDADKGETGLLRLKESTNDYMHIRDNDLPPLIIPEEIFQQAREHLKKNPLPSTYRNIFMETYGLTEKDAYEITIQKEICRFFLNICEFFHKDNRNNKDIALLYNIVTLDLANLSNKSKIPIWESKITPQNLLDLIGKLRDQSITIVSAKEVLEVLWNQAGDVSNIIKERNLAQIEDKDLIKVAVNKAITSNPNEVHRYLAGEVKLLQFFLGQIMRETKGKASHAIVEPLLLEQLNLQK